MTRLTDHQEKEFELKKRMRKAKIFERDLKETFVRSSGPGGQNVNKVSTCVQLVHIPTGLKVKCQAGRTQNANRVKAKHLLVAKLEKFHEKEESLLQYEHAKKKRQTRKKPQVLKEKILKEKHLRSEKKSSRKKVDINRLDE